MLQMITSKIPKAVEGSIVKFIREDNFPVFLDGDEELDKIRLTAPIEVVISAVAIRRAQQIARNYAISYKPELLHKFQIESLESVVKNDTKELL